MNKIAVVAKNKETHFIKRLSEEVGEPVPVFDPWSDLAFPEARRYVVRTTGVYGSELDLLMLGSLPPTAVVNPREVLGRFRAKDLQYRWFEESEVPCLPWLPVKGSDLLTVEKFFRLYPEAVVKPLRGQGGWGIEVLTWETFRPWRRRRGIDEDYLLQPFVKNAAEYRYFFIDGEAPLVLERRSKSGIAANFRRAGEARVAALPAEFQSDVEALVERSGAVYGAIDLIVDGGRAMVLELNAVPGVEQLEAVTGQNVVGRLVDRLLR
jgi:glutathione synthase/RimK-type ligase-like ATP-grasp enzyme